MTDRRTGVRASTLEKLQKLWQITKNSTFTLSDISYRFKEVGYSSEKSFTASINRFAKDGFLAGVGWGEYRWSITGTDLRLDRLTEIRDAPKNNNSAKSDHPPKKKPLSEQVFDDDELKAFFAMREYYETNKSKFSNGTFRIPVWKFIAEDPEYFGTKLIDFGIVASCKEDERGSIYVISLPKYTELETKLKSKPVTKINTILDIASEAEELEEEYRTLALSIQEDTTRVERLKKEKAAKMAKLEKIQKRRKELAATLSIDQISAFQRLVELRTQG